MKNAKGSHREWRITGRKERAHEVKTHTKKKAGFWQAYVTPMMQKYRIEQNVQEKRRKIKVIEIKGNKRKSGIKEQHKDEEKNIMRIEIR